MSYEKINSGLAGGFIARADVLRKKRRVFKRHYADDFKVWERAAEMTFAIEQRDDGFRSASLVFDNPELDMSGE